MDYGKKSIHEKQRKIKSSSNQLLSKIRVMSFRMLLILFIGATLSGISAGIGFVRGLIDTAPNIDFSQMAPNTFYTTILDNKGREIQKLVGRDANRIYVTIDDVPKHVQNAFIAIEDERFWEHNGIDVKGIFRAFFIGLSSEDGFYQGASTITQQLIKNQIFDGGLETNTVTRFQRKLQEQYLAIQLEDSLSKEQILQEYLNVINLGQNTLGVQSASYRYFNKPVSELTLSEAAVIAGITQNPSAYNPITYPENNREKRSVVLEYMKTQGYINEEEYKEAMDDVEVYERIQIVNKENNASNANNVTTYFEDALFNQVLNDLKNEGYTETQAYNSLYRGGLTIYSTLDQNIQKICDKVFRDKSFYPADSEWQLSYQLTIQSEDGKESHYNEQTLKAYFLKSNPNFDIYFKNKKDAKPYIKKYRNSLLRDTDTIVGEAINYVIQPQVSFVVMDQHTGYVKALEGGRGVKTGSRTLNRATDSLRQPGSTFKVLSTYLPALDTAGMTLATLVDDAPYMYPGTNRPVKNWSGESYKGPSTLRRGIYDSMNIVTVKVLEQVTPKTGYDYLLRLGFTSLVDSMTTEDGKTFSDIQLPTALGGLTKGVSNIELTAAFASIANQGIYQEPILYTKILNQDGSVLLERKPENKQVMKDSTAWLLTSAMEDVVTKGTGTKARFTEIDMPLAGKTGTTSDDIDLWFAGFTPHYTATIWGGYDLNKQQSDTGYHKTLWKTAMERIHKELGLSRKEFEKPDSIITASICTRCGGKAIPDNCRRATGGTCLQTEYFATGTEPEKTCNCHY